MKNGFLISFEGGEACGKTTQIREFENYLKSQNIDYIISREPGGTTIGEKIREILLNSKSDIDPLVELFLFNAARVEHLQKVVRPALEAGKVVVLDRFYDSTFAYQGYAGSLSPSTIAHVTKVAVGDCTPDLTFLLDITYEESMRRKMASEELKNLDRIESKSKDFHDKVRQGYLEIAKANQKRVFVVDATLKKENVFEDIKNEFERRYFKEKQK